jgi:predicted dehydrogenase
MRHTSRRSFLRTVGAAGTAAGLGFPAITRSASPNSKLGLAGIGGGGGKGESDLAAAAEGNTVVAICDSDRTRLAAALKKYNLPAEKGFTDFRKMLDTVKEIDACTVSTADHAHYPAAMHAMGLGKHVCVQKPLTNTLWEAQQLGLAADKKKVVTAMGNQGHTGEGMRLLKEWVQQGAIGAIKEIHVWTNRPIWPQGNGAKFETGKATPDTLDWEAWQAGNPLVGYTDGLHPFAWRGHTLYGAGAMGDMGCHLLDGPFWALDLDKSIMKDIVKIEAVAEEAGDKHWPKASEIKVHFPNVTIHWYDGGRKPKRPAQLEEGRNLSDGGFFMIGEKGAIYDQSDYCQSPRLIPESSHKEWIATGPKKTLDRSTHPGNPQAEWTHAIKNGLKCPSSFEYSVPLTYLCLIGNLAIQAGKESIEFDPNKLEVVGMPEAQKFIKRTYREGWEYSADKI